jgi:tetratricopeptide (TPR) repeat protein
MMESHPQLAAVLEHNPMMKAMLEDPQMLRQALDAMKSPDKLKAALKNVPGKPNAAAGVHQPGDDATSSSPDVLEVEPREPAAAPSMADVTKLAKEQAGVVDAEEKAVCDARAQRLGAAPTEIDVVDMANIEQGSSMPELGGGGGAYYQARGLAEQGQVEQAALYMRECVRLSPEFALARLQLAQLLIEQSRQSATQTTGQSSEMLISEAESELRKALQIQEGFAPASAQLGLLLGARGEVHYKEAKELLQTAVAQLPAWSAVMQHMQPETASAASSIGDDSEQVEVQAAAGALPLLASCYKSLGLIAGSTGDYTGQLLELTRALDHAEDAADRALADTAAEVDVDLAKARAQARAGAVGLVYSIGSQLAMCARHLQLDGAGQLSEGAQLASVRALRTCARVAKEEADETAEAKFRGLLLHLLVEWVSPLEAGAECGVTDVHSLLDELVELSERELQANGAASGGLAGDGRLSAEESAVLMAATAMALETHGREVDAVNQHLRTISAAHAQAEDPLALPSHGSLGGLFQRSFQGGLRSGSGAATVYGSGDGSGNMSEQEEHALRTIFHFLTFIEGMSDMPAQTPGGAAMGQQHAVATATAHRGIAVALIHLTNPAAAGSHIQHASSESYLRRAPSTAAKAASMFVLDEVNGFNLSSVYRSGLMEADVIAEAGDEIIRHLKRVADLTPEWTEARVQLGAALLEVAEGAALVGEPSVAKGTAAVESVAEFKAALRQLAADSPVLELTKGLLLRAEAAASTSGATVEAVTTEEEINAGGSTPEAGAGEGKDLGRMLEDARRLIAQGDMVRARVALEEAEMAIPEGDATAGDFNFLVPLDLGGVLLQLGDLVTAEAYIRTALGAKITAQDSIKVVALSRLRELVHRSADFERASRLLLLVDESRTLDAKTKHSNPDVLFELGSALLLTGYDSDLREAVECFHTATNLAGESTHHWCWLNLANAHLRMQETGITIGGLIEEGDGNNEAHLQKACDYCDNAIKVLDEQIVKGKAPGMGEQMGMQDPRQERKTALLFKANALHRAADLAAGPGGVAANPTPANFASSELVQAEALLREAIGADACYYEAHSELGALLVKTQRYPDARTHLESALATPAAMGSPAEARDRLLLVGILQAQQEWDGALKQCELALARRERLNPQQVQMFETFAAQTKQMLDKSE